MKKKVIFYVLTAVFLAVLILGGIVFFAEESPTVSKDDLPPNFEELLKEKYGQSDFVCLIDDIKVDIERYAIVKYFIKYSWVTYDQSRFETVVMIESTDQSALTQSAASCIRCGNLTVNPYYEEFINYPAEGEALGYKKQLISRYLPFDAPQSTFDIIVRYGDTEYVLKNIPFVCYY